MGRFLTLTAGNTPTCALASSVTGVTQSASDNSTKLATTAYVDNQVVVGTGANTALSNLAAVAINTSLLPGSDNAIDLGSGTKRTRQIYSAGLTTGTSAGNTLIISARDVDGAVDTTFITLTANNTPTCAIQNTSITGGTVSSLSSPIAVADGGTGRNTSTTAYGTICAGTTATGALQTVSPGTSGKALVSGGSSALPSYTTLGVDGGGTGVATLTTAYGTLCAGTTATGAVQTVSPGTSGKPLVSGGASALPAYGTLGVDGGGTGLASATAYAVICGGTTSTGAFQSIASVGTSGQVLTSNGAGALPTFQNASGVGGSLTYIAVGTASGSATVDFANNLTSTYDNYLIVWENLVPANNGTYLESRVGTGGTPTWQTSNYHGSLQGTRITSNDTVTTSGSDSANSSTSFMDLTVNASGSLMSNTATSAGAGFMYITNVNDASNDKAITGMTSYVANGSASGTGQATKDFAGRWNGATVLTSFRFVQSAGNLSTGKFRLYGIANS